MKTKEELVNFFEDFLQKKSLFKNKKNLQANHTPEELQHRDEQVNQIAGIMASSLRLEKPSNLFVYGKTGTGKTVTIKYTTNKIKEVAEKKDIPLKIVYVNCKLKKVADTEYRLVAQLLKEFGREVPITGLPTDEIYKMFYELVDQKEQLIILVLDEIDELVKRIGDEILYNFTRINSELQKTQISMIGISNNLTFINDVDPRIKSSLSEEEIIFPPYNAVQIQDILKNRCKEAFKPNTLEQGLIEKCAAYAARDHGDARRALELLRVAGEVAERKGQEQIMIQQLDEAEEKIEKDRVIDGIRAQPKQFHLTLYSILHINKKKENFIFTGEIYELYKSLCGQTGLRPLTQRRVSDIIAELDMLGVINAKTISKGRYGRTREISMMLPPQMVDKVETIVKETLDL